MAKLEYVEGIGSKYARDLRNIGVRSTADLLKKGGTAKGREELGKASGIGKKLILEWVNHVDLFRIKGVGEEYADLLEEAGVDTVVELPSAMLPTSMRPFWQPTLKRNWSANPRPKKWSASGLPRLKNYPVKLSIKL